MKQKDIIKRTKKEHIKRREIKKENKFQRKRESASLPAHNERREKRKHTERKREGSNEIRRDNKNTLRTKKKNTLLLNTIEDCDNRAEKKQLTPLTGGSTHFVERHLRLQEGAIVRMYCT